MTDKVFLKDFHRIILNNSAMWLNVLDKDAKVVMWNKAAEKISGYSEEEVIGKNDVWELLYPDAEYRNMVYTKALEIINQGDEVIDFETTIRCKDGSNCILSWNSHDLRNEQNEVIGSLALGRDVTDLHTSQKKLKELTWKLEQSNKHLLHLSEIDELTGLYNRRYMDSSLNYEWERHIRNDSLLSLIYIDIDYFKEYNDTYGHHIGDEALIEVAKIFKQSARRATDKSIRFGGEEFALLLPETTLAEAVSIAENVHQVVIQRKIEHTGSKISNILTVSIGVATVLPTRSETIRKLKIEADKALYNAKKLGRNRVESIEDV
ncbi:MAG: diguanylate cyclase [Acidiferrobacterales bacterium]